MLRKRRGLSLIETTLAMFLLVAEVLVLMGMFHQGLRNQTRMIMRTRAVSVMERTMSEIRAWAQTPANYSSGWTPYKNVSRRDTQDPEFTVDTTAMTPAEAAELVVRRMDDYREDYTI